MPSFLADCLAIFAVLLTIAGPVIWLRGLFSGSRAERYAGAIATTGLVTFAYFSLASHSLDEVDYKGISLLWSLMFIIVSVIYRPVEQLLSRSIAAGESSSCANIPSTDHRNPKYASPAQPMRTTAAAAANSSLGR